MGNIRIITDSASDMPVDYREDVTVVPLHVRFGLFSMGVAKC